ncbi:uncharacterized protein A4U43_C07F24460 [Asparagus officinalis]|uniref:Uncharacterized protein n=1 Tax=Asparagus officinalis TaxID=4686 RepID=A0A5P1EJT6_ASPOF|nr:uncharacterized protein A4U43_C07F24460 [Asparagus officinalis]
MRKAAAASAQSQRERQKTSRAEKLAAKRADDALDVDRESAAARRAWRAGVWRAARLGRRRRRAWVGVGRRRGQLVKGAKGASWEGVCSVLACGPREDESGRAGGGGESEDGSDAKARPDSVVADGRREMGGWGSERGERRERERERAGGEKREEPER